MPVSVNELDALATNVQTTAAKFGNKLRAVAASGLLVQALAWHGAAKQGGNCTKVARVVGAKLGLFRALVFLIERLALFHLPPPV
jgi:hypothetical protein